MRFVAVCDVKAERREAVKKMADAKYGNQDCADLSRPPRAAGPQRHRRGADRHRVRTGTPRPRSWRPRPARTCIARSPARRTSSQSLALAETMRAHGARLPGRHAAAEPAALRLRRRTGPQREARQAPDGLRPSRPGMDTVTSGWLPPEPEPPKEQVDWDLYLGPAAWRPFNRQAAGRVQLREGRRAWSAAASWNGARIAWTSASGPPTPIGTAPVEYNPPENGRVGRPLRQRRETGDPRRRLAAAGLVPGAVRGRHGLGRDGRQRQARAQLAGLAGRPKGGRNRRLPGHLPRPQFPRLREDSRRSRGPTPTWPATRTSPATRPTSRIFLDRKLAYDPVKNEFIGDEEANRLRSEALREPWRL